ncbi:SIMPL domain-containing protein [Pikeienuella piscinae]|uniref:SIMPL domain-containing protein n=1 Tax=Pikeienuella piscinae TaxID=2748098 RepID=A0A7L5BV79_9RHOB|nr:SIMPL domain-containing protein [Pikeienuella piscinae]QIE55261.1 SIMPL domain-containing protein [Pikeienuella piscinae]
MAGKLTGAGMAVAGLCLGVGAAVGGWLLGAALVESRAPARQVTVKGLAERVVEADAAVWRAPFRGVGATRDAAIDEAMRARDAVLDLGRDGGLPAEAMSVEPFALSIERTFLQKPGGGQEEKQRFVAAGAVRMRSDDAGLIEGLTGRTAELLDRGVLLGGDDYSGAARPVYTFTGLNEIKPEMIAEATRNARESAQRFAADSGSAVGRIITANQGVVAIFAADGDYDERSERRKRIRVVSTINYELVD